MPLYLIRRNINGRLLGQAVQNFDSDRDAKAAGRDTQRFLNAQFEKQTGQRAPCPRVEVLKLIWQGEPQLSQAPAAVRRRNNKKVDL